MLLFMYCLNLKIRLDTVILSEVLVLNEFPVLHKCSNVIIYVLLKSKNKVGYSYQS